MKMYRPREAQLDGLPRGCASRVVRHREAQRQRRKTDTIEVQDKEQGERADSQKRQ